MADVIDYKKEYKNLYLPKTEPSIIEIPEIIFAAISGKGDPNEAGGEYQEALEVLYGVQYTIKMSKKGTSIPKGYFDYVVPPLEGLWWPSNVNGVPDLKNKSQFNWISMIRLPEYVDENVFNWACETAAKKKKINTEKAQLLKLTEGLCVQAMHIGSYDDEPATIASMEQYAVGNGYAIDINDIRRHHEIYLTAPRKTAPEKWKTVIRHPVKRV